MSATSNLQDVRTPAGQAVTAGWFLKASIVVGSLATGFFSTSFLLRGLAHQVIISDDRYSRAQGEVYEPLLNSGVYAGLLSLGVFITWIIFILSTPPRPRSWFLALAVILGLAVAVLLIGNASFEPMSSLEIHRWADAR